MAVAWPSGFDIAGIGIEPWVARSTTWKPDASLAETGSDLLSESVLLARIKQYVHYSSYPLEQNTGIHRLYVRKGYREVKRERVYPHPLIHQTGDAILMAKDISTGLVDLGLGK